MLGPFAFLLVALAAGVGATYLSGLPLELEERVAYGAVIGLMAAGAAGFALALAFGLGVDTVLGGLGVAAAVGSWGWWTGRASVPSEAGGLRRRLVSLSPLWVLLAACWAYTIYLVARAYVFTPGGLEVWGIGVYSDWAAHLAYAGSFAYAQNLPPEYPIAPGHRMGYPFMVDFAAAQLVMLGSTLTGSLALTSGYLLLAFPAVMALAARRLTGSTRAGVLGTVIFLMAGGLGFATLHQPDRYTQDPGQNYQMLNPVLAYLLPQRSILFGLAVALIAAALLFGARASRAWAPHVFTGILVGITPAFHVHGYGTAVALGALWAVFDRRPQMLGFLVPALGMGVPIVLWLVQPGAAALRSQPGWLAGSDSWVWFWLKNAGLFIPLLLVAQLWPGLAGAFRLLFVPLWLWFIVPNLWVFQPWDWDNTKFLVFWLAFGSMLVGALLARAVRRGRGPGLLAGLATVLLCASGGLDLWKLVQPADRVLFTDAGGVAAADWARAHTAPRAVFLVAPDHNEPVAALGGRRVFAGYPGWMWTYGIPDWARRSQDAQSMLQGRLGAEGRVDYVVVGPAEIALGASPTYWNLRATLVYSAGRYAIYRVGSP